MVVRSTEEHTRSIRFISRFYLRTRTLVRKSCLGGVAVSRVPNLVSPQGKIRGLRYLAAVHPGRLDHHSSESLALDRTLLCPSPEVWGTLRTAGSDATSPPDLQRPC